VLSNGPLVLVVSDCDGLDETVKDLRRHGFAASPVHTGADAMARYSQFQVLLIDLDLKDYDGLTLCREIRQASDVPMIGFTSNGLDQILALEAGCDDCVEKPYRSRELVARIGALLRRARLSTSPWLICGDLSIRHNVREVRVGDRVVEMTRKEFELLYVLASGPGKIFTRAELLRRVWDYDVVESDVTPLASRTIDTHVSSLRKKLGAPHWIVTVRGVGFRFNQDASVSSGTNGVVMNRLWTLPHREANGSGERRANSAGR